MTAPASPPPVPEALRPWQEVFRQMPAEHLQLLARLMADFRPLIAEPEQAVPSLRGEFDAYDGIANRGGLERLLTGEWLWRDLEEGEFLRRLAEGELLYHRIRHRTPTENRAIGVLVDSGPWMLGRPRLVALAALLCLGRQAQRDGIPFFWRANSLIEPGWHEGFRLEAVRHYLTAVSATDLSLAEIIRAMAGPPAARPGKPPLMRWYLIGPRTHDLTEAPGMATQIVIAEAPRLGPDGGFAVDAAASLTAPSGRRRDVTIPCPPEAAATALLRHPFRLPEAPPLPPPAEDAAAEGQDWVLRHVAVIAPEKLILVRRPGGILVLDSGGAAPRCDFLPIRPYETLVGIGADRRGLTLARLLRYAGFGRLIVERYPKQGAAEPLFELRLEKDEPLCRGTHGIDVLPLLSGRGRRRIFWVCAPDGTAAEMTGGGVRRSRLLRNSRILQCGSDAVILHRRDGGLLARPLRRNAGITTFAAALPHRITAADIRYQPFDALMSVRLGDEWRTYRPRDEPWPVMASGIGQGTFLYSFKNERRRIAHVVLSRDRGLLAIDDIGAADHDLAAGDFRFDLVVPHEGSPHPVFAELAGQPFVTRLLQLGEDGAPRLTVIEERMQEARWLRN